jgi:NADH-quinone oxidoreductase subunit N
MGFLVNHLWAPKVELFSQMMVVDSYSTFFNLLFLACGAVTLMASYRYLDREKIQYPEFYLLVLFSIIGMMLMTASQNLILLFINLELMSLAIYALCGFRRSDRKSNEAAMKYFVLGSAASAILLMGIALLYGSTGTLQMDQIQSRMAAVNEGASLTFVMAVGLILVGFLFKIATVPFHMWMPDVYEGAPAPVTGLMTSALKAAAFATLVRFMISLGYGKALSASLQTNLHDLLWVLAVLTMLVGNVIALTQKNLKRMLAYSSISHTGYLLVGILAGPSSGGNYSSVILYLVTYAIMNIGAFAILGILANQDDSGLHLEDMSGLSRRHPFLSFGLAVFLLSMAGMPPTAGFVSKYYLFYSAIQSGEILLVVLGVLCSAIGVYYYLRVLVFIYMKNPAATTPTTRVSGWAGFAVATMLVLTLQVGLLPSRMLDLAKRAMTSLV